MYCKLNKCEYLYCKFQDIFLFQPKDSSLLRYKNNLLS